MFWSGSPVAVTNPIKPCIKKTFLALAALLLARSIIAILLTIYRFRGYN